MHSLWEYKLNLVCARFLGLDFCGEMSMTMIDEIKRLEGLGFTCSDFRECVEYFIGEERVRGSQIVFDQKKSEIVGCGGSEVNGGDAVFGSILFFSYDGDVADDDVMVMYFLTFLCLICFLFLGGYYLCWVDWNLDCLCGCGTFLIDQTYGGHRYSLPLHQGKKEMNSPVSYSMVFLCLSFYFLFFFANYLCKNI